PIRPAPTLARLIHGPSEPLVDVFRVEFRQNTKLVAGPPGGISVVDVPKEGLWLNFGQPNRAFVFLNRRLGQGLDTAVIKVCRVPQSFLERVRATAVPQSMAKSYPNSPLSSPDPAPDQFAIRGPALVELEVLLAGHALRQ